MDKTYLEKLKDPRWQKKRLEIFNRDEFKCKKCGNTKETLNIHHIKYIKDKEPWDYPNELLTTLCEDCHKIIEELRKNEFFKNFNEITIYRPSNQHNPDHDFFIISSLLVSFLMIRKNKSPIDGFLFIKKDIDELIKYLEGLKMEES